MTNPFFQPKKSDVDQTVDHHSPLLPQGEPTWDLETTKGFEPLINGASGGVFASDGEHDFEILELESQSNHDSSLSSPGSDSPLPLESRDLEDRTLEDPSEGSDRLRGTDSSSEHRIPDVAKTGVYDSSTSSSMQRIRKKKKGPRSVGGYLLGEMLGQGGMGRVYKATDSSGRQVALKLLSPDLTRSEDALARFKQEGLIASQINHPHCVFVHRVDEDAGIPFIAMELMTGQTLKDLVLEHGALPYENAVNYILQCMDGLIEAHSRGMIHRDIKPANCYLDEEGNVKLGDFGLARSLASDSELTQTGAFLGTPLFASPEQLLGHMIDVRSDIYSLTATLYYLLAGKAPFESPHAAQVIAKIASYDPPKLTSVGVDVPIALEQIVMKGLARDPKKRYDSVAKMRSDLMAFMAPKAAPASMPRRALAGIADMFILFLIVGLSIFVLMALEIVPQGRWVANLVGLVVGTLYYFVLEGVFSTSPGKAAMRLRVVNIHTGERPTALALAIRVATFVGCTTLPDVIFNLVSSEQFPVQDEIVSRLIAILGYVAIASTWRIKGQSQLLHDWVSGTECRYEQSIRRSVWVTLELPEPKSIRIIEQDPSLALPQKLGRFEIVGRIEGPDDTSEFFWLQARDPQLERNVWLAIVCDRTIEFEALQTDKPKPMCMRFIEEGVFYGGRWFAYVAPEGVPLRECLRIGLHLPWPVTRYILGQLANETTPGTTTTLGHKMRSKDWNIDRLWLDRSGRLSLVDLSLKQMQQHNPASKEFLLDFLKEISRLGLPASHPARRELELASSLSMKMIPVESLPPLRAERWLDSIATGKVSGQLNRLSEEIHQLDQAVPSVTNRMRFFNAILSLAFLAPFGFAIFVMFASASIGLLLDVRKDVQLLKSLQTYAFSPQDYPQFWKSISETERNHWLSDDRKDDITSALRDNELKLAQVYKNMGTIEKLVLNMVSLSGENVLSPKIMSLEKSNLPSENQLDVIEEQVLEKIEEEQTPELADIKTSFRRSGDKRPVEIRVNENRWSSKVTPEMLRLVDRYQTGTKPTYNSSSIPVASFSLTIAGALLIWTTVTYGGLCQHFTGLAIYRRNGRRMNLLVSLIRASILYVPLMLLIYLCSLTQLYGVEYVWWTTMLKRALTFIPVVYLVSTLFYTNMSLLDKLAGTAMVPR